MTDYTRKQNKYVYSINRKNNIGFVRYLLAFAVIVSHFNTLCGSDMTCVLNAYDAVCGFFVLSGFLLIYSVLKGKSLRNYLIDRCWRLLPSYFLVVVMASLLLSLVSALPAGVYFTSKDFWEYLGANLLTLNFLHPSLPGVFDGLYNDAVNGSLWTIKIEWQLSLTVPFLLLFLRKFKIDLRKAIIVVLLFSLVYRVVLWELYESTGKEIYEILSRQLLGQLGFFYCGALFYTYYEQVTRNLWKIAVASVAVFIIFKYFIASAFYDDFGYTIILTAVVVSVSLIPFDIGYFLDRGNNISYEIYLCHYPIFQIFAKYGLPEQLGTAWSFTLATGCTIVASVIVYVSVGRLYRTRKKRLASKNK